MNENSYYNWKTLAFAHSYIPRQGIYINKKPNGQINVSL